MEKNISGSQNAFVFYVAFLALVCVACYYPIYMGYITLESFYNQGYILMEEYRKYVIPYTPIAVSLILSILLIPWLLRRNIAFFYLFGLLVFLGVEIYMEEIPVAIREVVAVSEVSSPVETPIAPLPDTAEARLEVVKRTVRFTDTEYRLVMKRVFVFQMSMCRTLSPSEYELMEKNMLQGALERKAEGKKIEKDPYIESKYPGVFEVYSSERDSEYRNMSIEVTDTQWVPIAPPPATPDTLACSSTVRYDVDTTLNSASMIGPCPESSLYAENNPLYKIHFYAISFLIVLLTLKIGATIYLRLAKNEPVFSRNLLIQIAFLSVFLGLCIHANFTAFYRTGDLHVSFLSAFLMTLFFIVFGLTAGAFLMGEKARAPLLVALVSAGVTLMIYLCELHLLKGNLYIYGTGPLFDAIPGIVFAPFDLLVILFSGIFAYFIYGKKDA